MSHDYIHFHTSIREFTLLTNKTSTPHTVCNETTKPNETYLDC